MTPTAHAPDGRASWLRLLVSLALSTIGGIGLWSSVVVLPTIQAEFGIDRASAREQRPREFRIREDAGRIQVVRVSVIECDRKSRAPRGERSRAEMLLELAQWNDTQLSK